MIGLFKKPAGPRPFSGSLTNHGSEDDSQENPIHRGGQ